MNECIDGFAIKPYMCHFSWLNDDSTASEEKRYLDVAAHPGDKVVPTNEDIVVYLCDCEADWLKTLPGKVYNLRRRHKISQIGV